MSKTCEYARQIDASIAKLPPLSKWEEKMTYPTEAIHTLSLMSELLNHKGLKASETGRSVGCLLPYIDVDDFAIGIGFDFALNSYLTVDHDVKKPELSLWGTEENNPLFMDAQYYNVDDWKRAFKEVLKVDVKAL